MLHWLAGQKVPDGANDPDATGYIEPPETPAPVFAVRAFKHAIFGTPQTVQPKTRRNSTTDDRQVGHVEPRPTRPAMTRPRSANDAQALREDDAQGMLEPALASPTKGILLTPGTGAAKKKNVTFGNDIVEQKRHLHSDVLDDGYTGSGIKPVEDVYKEDLPETRRSRSKLTEALEQARDDCANPTSEAGKYWKHEYDIYRTNTQREVRKLITKQKAAKSFAREKDAQCTELADELRQERKKVGALETKISELTMLMKELHARLKADQETEKRQDGLKLSRPQLDRRDSLRPTSSDGTAVEVAQTATQRDIPEEKPAEDPIQRPSEPYKPPVEPEKPKTDLQALINRRAKEKQESVLRKSNDEPATPLKTLDVNARSDGREPTSPQFLGVDGNIKQRNASLVSKDGKEISQDRIEAARARINARGRVTS